MERSRDFAILISGSNDSFFMRTRYFVKPQYTLEIHPWWNWRSDNNTIRGLSLVLSDLGIICSWSGRTTVTVGTAKICLRCGSPQVSSQVPSPPSSHGRLHCTTPTYSECSLQPSRLKVSEVRSGRLPLRVSKSDYPRLYRSTLLLSLHSRKPLFLHHQPSTTGDPPLTHWPGDRRLSPFCDFGRLYSSNC